MTLELVGVLQLTVSEPAVTIVKPATDDHEPVREQRVPKVIPLPVGRCGICHALVAFQDDATHGRWHEEMRMGRIR